MTGAYGAGYFRPVSHYLGMLTTRLARWDEAERCFEAALEMNTTMRVARTQYEYAAMLNARRGPGDAAEAPALLSAALETGRRSRHDS